MRKVYTILNLEKPNARNFRIAADYFGCRNLTEMLGLLLRLAGLDTPDTITPGEPTNSMFERHCHVQPNNELRKLLKSKSDVQD